MSGSDELRHHIKHAPDLPGVYLYRDASGDVLYVGKALSLRKRLANYLPALEGGDAGRVPAKVAEMVSRSAAVEWIVTTNEVEALILEHNLIKQHRPPFNIRLRDDKSYPYIMITAEDEFPRVMFTRQAHRRGNLYFGPFSSAAKVRETLDVLGRVFPVRACRGRQPGRRNGSPCLQFHIDRCPGPCLGTVDVADYGAVVGQVVDFLSGRETRVVARLERSMQEAAERQDFESAAVFRDRLEALSHVLERQRIESSSLGSADVTGMAVDGWGANVQVFITRDGKLADRRSFTLVNVEGAGEQEIFERFVSEYYASSPTVPAELIVPGAVVDTGSLAAFLEKLRGTKVDVRQAERGDKRRLQELADRNAALALAHERLREERTRERRYGALTALEERPGSGKRAHADRRLRHLQSGSGEYRGFHGGVRGGSAEEERLPQVRHPLHRRPGRRGRHARGAGAPFHPGRGRIATALDERGGLDRPYDRSFEAVPDLVVVDGGKGQLGGALDALREAGVDGGGHRDLAGQAGGGGLRPLVARPSRPCPRRCRACCFCRGCAMKPTVLR